MDLTPGRGERVSFLPIADQARMYLEEREMKIVSISTTALEQIWESAYQAGREDAARELAEINEKLRVAERERDSLARRLSVRYEELENARTEAETLTDQLGDMRATMSAAELDRDDAAALLADLVVKCTEYGVQDGEFVAMYLLPTGPVHRAIPWLEERGVIVRPGFDGRKAISLGRSAGGVGDNPEEQR